MNSFSLSLLIKGNTPQKIRLLVGKLAIEMEEAIDYLHENSLSKKEAREYVTEQYPFLSRAFDNKNYIARLQNLSYLKKQLSNEAKRLAQLRHSKHLRTAIRNRRRMASVEYWHKRYLQANGRYYSSAITDRNGELFLSINDLASYISKLNKTIPVFSHSESKGYEGILKHKESWLKKELARVRKRFKYSSFEMRTIRSREIEDGERYAQNRVLIDKKGNKLAFGSSEEIFERRFSEYFARVKSMEMLADEKGLRWLFFTLTCPPRMHPAPIYGKDSYDGTTVREAVDFLNERWSAATRRFSEIGVKLSNADAFGFKVIEPHQDGCPHAHVLLFVEESFVRPIMEEVLKAFDYEDEYTSKRKRTKKYEKKMNQNYGRLMTPFGECKTRSVSIKLGVEQSNSEKMAATPSSYISKYILKHTKISRAEEQNCSPEQLSSMAIDAWRACSRIRAFTFIGFKGVVGKWRMARKVDNDKVLNMSGKQLIAVLLAKGLMINRVNKGGEVEKLSLVPTTWKASGRYKAFITLLESSEVQQIRTYFSNCYGELVSKVSAFRIDGKHVKPKRFTLQPINHCNKI